jgi:hypothetical protein
MIIGAMVTQAADVWFTKRLVHVTFPRVRDFRGIDRKRSIKGNLTVGLGHLASGNQPKSEYLRSEVSLHYRENQSGRLRFTFEFPFRSNKTMARTAVVKAKKAKFSPALAALLAAAQSWLYARL